MATTISSLAITAKLRAKLNEAQPDGATAEMDYTQGLYTVVPATVDLLYNTRLSMTTTQIVDIDLAGSSVDALGNTLTFVKVHAIYIRNRSEVASDVIRIGGDTNAVPLFGAVADYFVLGPNGVFLVTSPLDGWTVTAATGDILQLENPGGNTVDVDVAILGSST